MPTGDDSNGRVTMAVLGTKLDYVQRSVDQIGRRLDDICDQAVDRDERLGKVENTLKVITWVGGAVAAILIAIATAWAKAVLGL